MVDFMIIGAQKAGTTTLYEILDTHPQLHGASNKEPQFFSKYPDWRARLDDYTALFEPAGGRLCFEASTSYTNFPLEPNTRICEDLAEYNPALKFIYIVREPIARIQSAYLHYVLRGYTRDPIEIAIRQNPVFLNITRYASQIAPYIRTFGRERVLIADFDDLIQRPEALLGCIARFLQVDADPFEAAVDVHANNSATKYERHYRFDNPPFPLNHLARHWPRAWTLLTLNLRSLLPREKPPVTPELKCIVHGTLEREVRELEALMQKDLGHWLA